VVREVPSEEVVFAQDLNEKEEPTLTSSLTFSAHVVSVDMLKVTHVLGGVKCS